MFAIYVDGECVEYCEKPYYLKKYMDPQTEVERFVKADSYDEAVAISVHGLIYSLPFKEPIEEHETEAVIVEKQAGFYLYENKENIDKNAINIAENQEILEEALCEVDASTEDRIALLEDVICELDARLG